ncbi:Translation elongation factor 1 beta [Paecilomyces lecythidis]|uniref:Translation elongation factor 1 beta n=1 Tax=Paecilomyces lecythidis TaxID=3004212 RepID=A0ABR3XLS7_9EURO
MGFTDLTDHAGLSALNDWLATRSYIISSSPSQADVACFKAIKSSPDSSLYPHAARWYKNIASCEDEFASLPGDPSKAYTSYGPEDIINSATATGRADDNDEIDLFCSDEEDPETARIHEERLAAYKAKRADKPKPAAKSVVIMEVKPWDDETDMVALEAAVRGIEKNGLVWGTSKLVPVGFGVKKLQINLVVEDDKVSVTDLQEEIEDFADYVQSSDVVTMQKL